MNVSFKKSNSEISKKDLIALAATLRGSRPGVQSASLIMTSSHYDVTDDVITRKI